MTILSCFVPGTPIPQGSMSAFVNPVTGRAIVTDQKGKTLKPWRREVARVAAAACAAPAIGPVDVQMIFYLPRPQKIPKERQGAPCVRPDLDKLVRAVLDGLTGVAFEDDGQVVDLRAHKRYEDGPLGVHIDVYRWTS